MGNGATILVVIGWLLTLSGLAVTIIMQVWVQPKWFREDSRSQARLITDRFDAQLQALKLLSERAAETVTKAAQFFQDAEHELKEHDSRLKEVEHVLREEVSLRHKMVDEIRNLRDRLATIEGVCKGRHEESIKNFADMRHDSDDDTQGVPRKKGC